jgi:hypothetical protein
MPSEEQAAAGNADSGAATDASVGKWIGLVQCLSIIPVLDSTTHVHHC